MERIKNIFKNIDIYLCIIIPIIFFGALVFIQYAPDTYFVFTNTTRSVINQFATGGRIVTALIAGVCLGIMNLSDKIIYFLSYTFAIICTIISLYRLNNLLKKDIDNKVVSLIIATLIIINPFSIELYIYIEKGIMMFSVLICILAVEQLEKHFINKTWKEFIIALVFVMIAICSYQGTVGIFVALSLLYIIKYSNNIVEFLLNNFKVATIYGIPAIFNYLIVKFVASNSRVKGQIILSESINKIMQGLKELIFNTYNILPKYLFSIIIFGLIIFIIYKIVFFEKEEKKKNKILKFVWIFYIFIGITAVTIAPQILQDTNSIWFVARSSYPMASIIGIFLVYVFQQFNIKNYEKNIIILISILFLCIQLICFARIIIDSYIVNYIDKKETAEIIEQIEEYEKESGNQITKIAIYKDENTTFVHQGIKASGDINVRALCTDWASRFIINYYSNRDLKEAEKDIELQEEFSQRDWENFDEEQLVFENDTIHICLY